MNDTNDFITIEWHVDDVMEECPQLEPEQARKVLHTLKHNHDACIGINWNVIRTVAAILYPESEE